MLPFNGSVIKVCVQHHDGLQTILSMIVSIFFSIWAMPFSTNLPLAGIQLFLPHLSQLMPCMVIAWRLTLSSYRPIYLVIFWLKHKESHTNSRSYNENTPLWIPNRIESTQEIPVLNQRWGDCNYPTSNWPYQGHQGQYLVLKKLAESR